MLTVFYFSNFAPIPRFFTLFQRYVDYSDLGPLGCNESLWIVPSTEDLS